MEKEIWENLTTGTETEMDGTTYIHIFLQTGYIPLSDIIRLFTIMIFISILPANHERDPTNNPPGCVVATLP